MFASYRQIGAGKVPVVSLLLKCLRVGRDVSKHFQPKGLAQSVATNVVGHLAIFVPGLGTLVYVDGFTRDVVQEYGEASLECSHKVSLG
jgi:hypothetical protein